MARKKWLPDNVTEYKDRHGKPRYRFRKKGLAPYTFRHAPGTTEFMAELHAAKTGEPVKVERFIPFSYDALIDAFYRTAEWANCSDSTNKALMADQAMANLSGRFAISTGENGKNASDSNEKEKSGGGQG